MPLELTPREHQELVLMTGSKKEWATYLGLDPKQASSTWIELGLKARIFDLSQGLAVSGAPTSGGGEGEVDL